MDYTVRKALPGDLDRIEQIYAYARDFMEKTGNPNQWRKTEPRHAQLVKDIELGDLYVVTREEQIHGVFYFWIGPDPTYQQIFEGSWRWNGSYGTIHRIASDGSGGILKTAVDFCSGLCSHIRIDTHHDNTVMRNAVKKLGFTPSGIIYIADGTPRIAYEKE